MFKGELYPSQKLAAEFLCKKKKAGLFWEQGTGKTIISVAAADKLLDLGKIQSVLVLAQPANAWQWKEKIEAFTDHPAHLVQAADKDSRTYDPRGFVVLPYSLFRNDFDANLLRNFDLIIADEAQEFRNFKAKTSKLIKRLKPEYRWALTGTAISNKLEELYNILSWVDKNFLPPWPEFERRHIVRGQLGFITDYKNLKGLNEYLEHKIDRKTHSDLKGQIPKMVEQIYTVEASTDYSKAESALLDVLDRMAADVYIDEDGNVKGSGKKNPEVTRAFLECRKALYGDNKLRLALERINTILEENPRNRVVVFSQFKEPIYRLHGWLGREAVKFTGDEPSIEKHHNIQTFRSGAARVLLASNAGAAGLDLPFANYIIHIDIPFSHGILDQRNKRITRVGSSWDFSVISYLVTCNSIEEYYLEQVKRKGQLASAALEGTQDNVEARTISLRQFIRSQGSTVSSVKKRAGQTKRKNRSTKSSNKTRAVRKR